MSKQTLPLPLSTFVEQLQTELDNSSDETIFLPQIATAMKTLVSQDNWLDPAFAQPHPQYYQQYLLYAAPDDSFSVVSFVWGPGQSTPIHDHTVWGVIGVLRGAELVQNFDTNTDSSHLIEQPEERLNPGETGLVSPTIGDIHRVRNAYSDQVSISIHAYGANIGKTSRHVFSAEDGSQKTFISGYSNS